MVGNQNLTFFTNIDIIGDILGWLIEKATVDEFVFVKISLTMQPALKTLNKFGVFAKS